MVGKIRSSKSNWSLDLTKYAEAKKEHINTCRKKVAIKIYESIVEYTPVKTGRARANWQITIGKKANGEVKGSDPSPYGSKPKDLPQQEIKIGKMGKSEEPIYITNNLPYIVGLEYGKSKQSPNGMVGVTLLDIQNKIKEAVRESE